MIYVDSCILIYALEDDSGRGDRVREQLASLGETTLAISPVVAMECTVGPMRSGDLALRDAYLSLFDRMRMLPLGVDAYLRAAELRALHNLASPDALHLAAAQLNECTALWTNDSRLEKASHGFAVNALA